tara:strand:+ start:793 stop:1647 length:855 start_codon:yes stop_codon:yes gene_type:complete
MNLLLGKLKLAISAVYGQLPNLYVFKFRSKAPLIVTIFLLIICLYLLINISWKVIFPEVSSNDFIKSISTSSQGSKENYDNLIADPFLMANSPSISDSFILDAPPTALSLRLYGIRYSESGEANAAILGFDPHNQRIYRTNDIIADDIVLEYIEPERVFISREEIIESITFEKDSVLSKTFRESFVNKKLITTQQKWTENNILSEMVKFQPYFSDGSVKGYQLYPGNNSGLFNQTGLKPGDLLVAINGLSVKDPTVLKELSGVGDLRLDLIRDDDDLSITVNLD